MRPKDAKIEIYQDKRNQWRWRFAVKRKDDAWDIQAMSSDAYMTAEQAELNARFIVCHPWAADVDFEIPLSFWQKLINYFTR